jgi:GTPase SAR1 family protein
MLTSRIAAKILPILALIAGFITIAPQIVKADGLPGFTLFSGVESGDSLTYNLSSDNRRDIARYRLKIPGTKIHKLGATQFQITYPKYYLGQFDEKAVEVFVGEKAIPVKAVKWERDRQLLQIDVAERIKTEEEIQLVLNNVKNPDSPGMFYFNCQAKSSAEFPIARYVGTWILDIN